MVSLLKRMGIAAKLMVSPVIVAFLLLAFGLFSHFSMFYVQDGLDELLSGAIARERIAQETEAAVNATHAAAYRSLALLNLRSDKARESAAEIMARQLTQLGEVDRALAASSDAKVRDLGAKLQVFDKAVREAYDSAVSDTNLGAMMMQTVDKDYDDLILSLQALGAASRIASTPQFRAAHSAATPNATIPATFSVPARMPRSCPPPRTRRSSISASPDASASAPTPFGPPILCAERMIASTPSGPARQLMRPAACTASHTTTPPFAWTMSAAARTGWMAPVSLLAA